MPPRPSRWAGVALLAVACLLAPAVPVAADEGMWLLDQPPLDRIEAEYGFRPSPEWLEHLQKASLRFSSGGSGSFVSADGLVITNHHVASSQIAKLSTPDRDLLTDGFHAARRQDELPTPDLQVLSLQQIEDVTARVKGAATPAMAAAEAEAARRSMIAEIERESQEETGLHSEVVTLYGGGLYHLYRYKRYTDVRLVFAPESAVAAFGGDVDNFEFPRFCLDFTLLRVYENGEPVRPEHYLEVSTAGLAAGDPAFVTGHPGRTQRGYTVDHLRFLRDVAYPATMRYVRTREVELTAFGAGSDERRRQAERDLSGIQNARKGLGGKLRALQDPRILKLKVDEERRLREALAADPELAAEIGDPWAEIAAAQLRFRDFYLRHALFEVRPFGGSDLFAIARHLVRLAEERGKPNGERLSEYTDSRLPSLERRLYSPAPIYPELEMEGVESWLAFAAELLGGDDPLVAALLAGKSPADRARELVAGSALADVEVRRSLAEQGALAAADDPMIAVARQLDRPARELRERHEDEVEAVERDAYARLTAARFAAFGDRLYPDATFTLRLSLGRVDGYVQEGAAVAPFTDLAGLYARSAERGAEPPFDLPASWVGARERLALDTPYNFVSTNDIIGGNSGSPVVDVDGRFVGIIFDGNRYSFVWDTIFTAEAGRAVSVDARAIVEVLAIVYGADELVAELVSRR